MGESSNPVQQTTVEVKTNKTGILFVFRMFPNMEQKSKLCLLHMTDIDDLQENEVVNQTRFCFGKSHNSKHLEK